MPLRFRFVPLLLALASVANAQDDFLLKLKALPRVKEVHTFTGRAPNSYEVMFEQPVDHQHPHGRKFLQRVFVSHAGYDKPNLLTTEGYESHGPLGGELSRMLGGPNLITVEHRYFGKSITNPRVWKYLTVKNSVDDLHDIVTTFKRLYSAKWVSTGASKSGQTSLFFKCYYPNDVDATVAYVAPVNIAQEDPRIYNYFETVGDAETRRKILDLQIAYLKREDEILPLLNTKPENFKMGAAKAYEYGVLEFPFAMWQYGKAPEKIPTPDAPTSELVDLYKKVNGMYYYSDAGIKQFEAAQYQFYTELGYYNYDITELKPYLKNNPDPTNMDLLPEGTKATVVFDPRTMAFVYHYLQYNANKVALIYGESDPWSATQLPLIGHTDAIKLVVKGAWHNASVRLASPEQKSLFYSSLERWLGMPITRL